MVEILSVLSASGKVAMLDEEFGNHDVRYLTLGERNPASGNRYYVCLTREDAEIAFEVGDKVMVELNMCAYKHSGRWHKCLRGDSMKLIEMENVNVLSNN